MYEVRIRIESRTIADGAITASGVTLETVQELGEAMTAPTTCSAVEFGMALAFSRFMRDIVTYMEQETAHGDKTPTWEEMVDSVRQKCLLQLQNAAGDYARDVLTRSPVDETPDDPPIDWNLLMRHITKGDAA